MFEMNVSQLAVVSFTIALSVFALACGGTSAPDAGEDADVMVVADALDARGEEAADAEDAPVAIDSGADAEDALAEDALAGDASEDAPTDAASGD